MNVENNLLTNKHKLEGVSLTFVKKTDFSVKVYDKKNKVSKIRSKITPPNQLCCQNV